MCFLILSQIVINVGYMLQLSLQYFAVKFLKCIVISAIRPDRDVIGKQKNPRRKKLRREESSLPSPGADSHWLVQIFKFTS